MISQPWDPVLMFKSFLSVGEFASLYNIWYMWRSQTPDNSVHKGARGEKGKIIHSDPSRTVTSAISNTWTCRFDVQLYIGTNVYEKIPAMIGR